MSQQNVALRERTAVITGASRGIGACIARELSASGAYVVLTYCSNEALANDVLADIVASGGRGEVRHVDVTRIDLCDALFAGLASCGIHVDLLVNNAGIARDRSFRKMSTDEFTDILDTNLLGAVYCTKMAIPSMIERRFGRIVNIASIIGQIGAFGQTNYAAAKGALISFTKALSLEVAKYDITVNAVCPGYVRTDMWKAIPDNIKEQILATIPMRRVAEPIEIASCVRYLVSEGSYITGQTVNVNGGLFRG